MGDYLASTNWFILQYHVELPKARQKAFESPSISLSCIESSSLSAISLKPAPSRTLSVSRNKGSSFEADWRYSDSHESKSEVSWPRKLKSWRFDRLNLLAGSRCTCSAHNTPPKNKTSKRGCYTPFLYPSAGPLKPGFLKAGWVWKVGPDFKRASSFFFPECKPGFFLQRARLWAGDWIKKRRTHEPLNWMIEWTPLQLCRSCHLYRCKMQHCPPVMILEVYTRILYLVSRSPLYPPKFTIAESVALWATCSRSLASWTCCWQWKRYEQWKHFGWKKTGRWFSHTSIPLRYQL